MKTKQIRAWIIAAFIIAVLSISPFVLATEEDRREGLQPKVIVRVDGLTCPF